MATEETWVTTQQRAFTVWVNHTLQRHPDIDRLGKVEVVDIHHDFQDGLKLLRLVEACTGSLIPTYEKNPNHRIKMINNANYALQAITEAGVKLVNIGPDDIVDANLRIILGLIWCMILKFQDLSDKNVVLTWMRQALKGFDGVNVTNFTTSWRDGLGFNALINLFLPEEFDFDRLDPAAASHNLKHAFDVAEEKLGIPRILRVEDLMSSQPDEHSILTYLSYFRNLSKETPPEKPNWKMKFREIEEKRNRLREELDKARENTAAARQGLTQENEELQRQIDEAIMNLGTAQEQFVQLNSDIKFGKLETEHMDEEVETTTTALHVAEADMEQLGPTLRLEEENLSALKQEVEQLRKTYAELEDRLTATQAEHTALESERKATVQKLEGDVSRLHEEIVRFTKPILKGVKIEGKPVVGQILEAHPIDFTGPVEYAWYHVGDNNSLIPMSSASKGSYRLTAPDFEANLRVHCIPVSPAGVKGDSAEANIGPVDIEPDIRKSLDSFRAQGRAEFDVLQRTTLGDQRRTLRLTNKNKLKLMQDARVLQKYNILSPGFRLTLNEKDARSLKISDPDHGEVSLSASKPEDRDVLALLLQKWIPGKSSFLERLGMSFGLGRGPSNSILGEEQSGRPYGRSHSKISESGGDDSSIPSAGSFRVALIPQGENPM